MPSSFPPLLAAPAIAHNLPEVRTSFIGRDTDLKLVNELLRTGPLVTLVGPGGAGKTRLAIEAGRRSLDEFPDGVWLAELAVLRDPAQVPTAVAKAMGHHDPLAETGGPALVRDRLAAAIGRQQRVAGAGQLRACGRGSRRARRRPFGHLPGTGRFGDQPPVAGRGRGAAGRGRLPGPARR